MVTVQRADVLFEPAMTVPFLVQFGLRQLKQDVPSRIFILVTLGIPNGLVPILLSLVVSKARDRPVVPVGVPEQIDAGDFHGTMVAHG